MSQLAVAYCCGCALEIAEAASKKALRKSFGAIADDNAITAIFTDKIYKPIFQLATGSWVGPGIATVLEKRLVQMQSNGIASTLEDALQRTQAWTDRDIEAAKDALEFYYTEVDAATFVVESEEITNEAVFDLLDWVTDGLLTLALWKAASSVPSFSDTDQRIRQLPNGTWQVEVCSQTGTRCDFERLELPSCAVDEAKFTIEFCLETSQNLSGSPQGHPRTSLRALRSFLTRTSC